MASKHSKSFFDFRKSKYSLPTEKKPNIFGNISLPFKIAISVFILALVVTAGIVTVFFMQSNSHNELLTDAKTTFYSTDSKKALQILAEQNSDIKGWIQIDGTNIDCAVCQGEDNSFYIDHNQLGESSRYGALFLQANDSIERSGDDKNIVIFGNNMKDGSMFGSLKKYRNLNFYKSNPFIKLYHGDKTETYVVFSVMLVSSMDNDGGQIYKPYKSHFADENDFDEWQNEAKLRSIINTDVTAEYGDDMLTLVTVADDFDGARLVVMAKQVIEWDAEHTNVISASYNPKPKYPKIWYTTKGLEYPYKNKKGE